ncbi:MAG: hypothetical protein ACJ8G7_08100 [Rhizobacter sp.]
MALSSRSVSLGWAAASGAVTIERRTGSGDYAAIASLEAGAAYYVDEGLAKNTTYGWRLVSADAAHEPLAEASATTNDEEPVVTAAGAPIGNDVAQTVGPAGGRIVSTDGHITLDIPAGALAADAELRVAPVANTAPDGVDAGLHVRLSAVPGKPLTVTVGYDAELAPQADGLRIALQRADGSWLSLPVAGSDATARTLSSIVPPELLAPAAAAKASALSARRAGASISIDFHVVKYLAYYLLPRQKTVEVGKTQELKPVTRVRGYEITIDRCQTVEDGLDLCLPVPVMETRELPLLNTKAGYARQWRIEEGGGAFGTVTPNGSVGAVYTAPAQVPDPRTVTVAFESVNQRTGRRVVLRSRITIVEDKWTGTMTAADGPSDAGTTIIAEARVTWRRDNPDSAEATRRYHPEGTLGVVVDDDDCTIGVTPSVQDLSREPRLAMLEIDDSVQPPTYRARLITFWNATLNASCPKASNSGPLLAGWGWDVQGTVSADGSTIAGHAMQDTARIDWMFKR